MKKELGDLVGEGEGYVWGKNETMMSTTVLVYRDFAATIHVSGTASEGHYVTRFKMDTAVKDLAVWLEANEWKEGGAEGYTSLPLFLNET